MRPLTLAEVKSKFGMFAWREGTGGAIIIDKNWVALNIVRVDIPIVGTVVCHKAVSLDLYRIFSEISQAGLSQHVNVDEFKRNVAGCWVARHKCWDAGRGLSRHSWGIAIDLNVKDNPYNKPPKQNMDIVGIFERRGFFWGGRFTVQDGMHFEPSEQFRLLVEVRPLRRH